MGRHNQRIVLPVLLATICLSLVASLISIYSDQQNADNAKYEMVGLSSVSGDEKTVADSGLQELSIRNSRSLFMSSPIQNMGPQTNKEQRPYEALSSPNRARRLNRELATFELDGLDHDSFGSEVPNTLPRKFAGEDHLVRDSKTNTLGSPVRSRDVSTIPRIHPISTRLKKRIEEITPQASRPIALHGLPPGGVATVSQNMADADRRAQSDKTLGTDLERWDALSAIAESLDRQAASTRHSTLLSKAMTAIREAEDFVTGIDDIGMIVAKHETPILQSEEKPGISGMQAMLIYCQHAESLLGKALNWDATASETLLSLGRQFGDSNRIGENPEYQNAKSMVMYRLAVRLNPTDARALSELGLLYAKLNQFTEAKELLKSSLRITPVASTWESLASVHATLGEQQLAQQAMQESRILASSVGLEQ